MATQPDKPLITERWTQSRFAAFIDVDPAVISRAVSRGILTRGADWITWNRELHHYQAENAAGHSGDAELNLALERARLARAQTQKLHLDIKKSRDEFVSVEAVSFAIVQINGTIRSKLLALAHRIKSNIPQLPTKAVTVVDDLVRDALEELGNQRLPQAVIVRMRSLDDAAFKKEIILETDHTGRPKGKRVHKKKRRRTDAKIK